MVSPFHDHLLRGLLDRDRVLCVWLPLVDPAGSDHRFGRPGEQTPAHGDFPESFISAERNQSRSGAVQRLDDGELPEPLQPDVAMRYAAVDVSRRAHRELALGAPGSRRRHRHPAGTNRARRLH